MLVLTRKTGQQIRIGADVTVTVVSVRGGYVRLGIEAPRDVRVRRGEVPMPAGDEEAATAVHHAAKEGNPPSDRRDGPAS